MGMTQATCERCGYDFEYPSNYTAGNRTFDGSLCVSCKAKPKVQVRYGDDYCTPWHGDYDLDDNPIKDGKLWKPGIRTCGHTDCVRASHVIPLPIHTTRTPSDVQAA